jgi:hypothetical protein
MASADVHSRPSGQEDIFPNIYPSHIVHRCLFSVRPRAGTAATQGRERGEPDGRETAAEAATRPGSSTGRTPPPRTRPPPPSNDHGYQRPTQVRQMSNVSCRSLLKYTCASLLLQVNWNWNGPAGQVYQLLECALYPDSFFLSKQSRRKLKHWITMPFNVSFVSFSIKVYLTRGKIFLWKTSKLCLSGGSHSVDPVDWQSFSRRNGRLPGCREYGLGGD